MKLSIASLRAAGVTADMIVVAMEFEQAASDDKRRAATRERTRRWRSRDVGDARDTSDASQASHGVTYEQNQGLASVTGAEHDNNGSYIERKKDISPIRKKERSKSLGVLKRIKHLLPVDWEPSESLLSYGEAQGLSRAQVLKTIENLRLWAKANAVLKADWDATAQGFFRRDADKLGLVPVTAGLAQPSEDLKRRSAELAEKYRRLFNERKPDDVSTASVGIHQIDEGRLQLGTRDATVGLVGGLFPREVGDVAERDDEFRGEVHAWRNGSSRVA
jgi:hypothetical protein